MYFITDKEKINFWSKDLLEIAKIYKKNNELIVFEEEYTTLKSLSKEYLDFLNKNPIKPNDLKVGNIFECFGSKERNETYKVLEIKYNEQDNYYTHICEVLQTGKIINYGLYWTHYVNLIE